MTIGQAKSKSTWFCLCLTDVFYNSSIFFISTQTSTSLSSVCSFLATDPEIRRSVDLSFQIVDRIHDILVSKGMKQKDLALLLGKREAELSKSMRGTHNFTIDTLVSIEDALQASILNVVHQDLEICV